MLHWRWEALYEANYRSMRHAQEVYDYLAKWRDKALALQDDGLMCVQEDVFDEQPKGLFRKKRKPAAHQQEDEDLRQIEYLLRQSRVATYDLFDKLRWAIDLIFVDDCLGKVRGDFDPREISDNLMQQLNSCVDEAQSAFTAVRNCSCRATENMPGYEEYLESTEEFIKHAMQFIEELASILRALQEMDCECAPVLDGSGSRDNGKVMRALWEAERSSGIMCQKIAQDEERSPGSPHEGIEKISSLMKRDGLDGSLWGVPVMPLKVSPEGMGGLGAFLSPREAPPTADEISFSAITPKAVRRGEYAIVDLVLYEEAFRPIVETIMQEQEDGARETVGSAQTINRETMVKVVLSSSDVEIDEPEFQQVWQGKYLRFSFDFEVPKTLKKPQIKLRATVYFNDVPVTRLRMLVSCVQKAREAVEVIRRDVHSAFISYASVDRARVISIIQGIQQVRPDMDVFLDIDSLRSGENWEARLCREIEQRDVFYLCWSQAARKSPFVEMEWQHALSAKGIEAIEPIPLETPDLCPPPAELNKLHFNHRLLYMLRVVP